MKRARSSFGYSATSLSRSSFCFTTSPLAPASLARMNSFSPFEVLSARLTALFRCSKNSLAVGELLALGQLSGSEVGIERNGLIEMLQRILGEQFLGQAHDLARIRLSRRSTWW